MTNYKIVQISNLAIVASYVDVNPYGGPWGSPNSGFQSVAVSNGIDPNGVIAQLDGNGNIVLVFDQPTLDAYHRSQNEIALQVFSSARSITADNSIAAALAAATGQNDDDVTHLMIVAAANDVLAFPSAWLQTLSGDLTSGSKTISNLTRTDTLEVGSAVTGSNIPTGTTLVQIFDASSIQISNAAIANSTGQNINFDPSPVAIATLAAYRPVFFQIQQIRKQRDADIAAFVPPYTNVSPLYPV